MLNLVAATGPRWITRALESLDELLVDHAHCEKKAAGMAVHLIFRYPQHAFLQEPLSRLAREELLHFEAVLRLLDDRGVAFRPLRPAPYAGRLRKQTRTYEPARLVDTLLCCALIEARSCERFQVLSEAVDDPVLRDFYAGLLASEARHHGVYLDLAERLEESPVVRGRLAELAECEAELLASAPELPRMHS